MCGIMIWANTERRVSAERATSALMLQNHRGPDNQHLNFWIHGRDTQSLVSAEKITAGSRGDGFNLVLGHNRLSIIDLNKRSNQPMFSDDSRYAIVFNGMIYNYQELRRELASLGEVFHTESDTEVLLKALIRWGENCILRLNGMWAFALLDMERGTIFLSRDNYGKKPLYYYYDQIDFIVASEIKTIYAILGHKRRKLRRDHLGVFLSSGFLSTDDDGSTFYDGILLLGAGRCLKFDIAKHVMKVEGDNTIRQFLKDSVDPRSLPNDIEAAVKMRLRADVPIAILLSGGVDSSVVAAYACKDDSVGNRIRFYTGKTGHGKDLFYARLAAKALKVSLTEIDIPYGGEILNHMQKLTHQYEMPVPLLGNTIAVSRMYQAMSDDGIRVVLDGTGGDEIFGGYFDVYGPGMINTLFNEKQILEMIKFFSYCFVFKQISFKILFRQLINRLSCAENKRVLTHYCVLMIIKALNIIKRQTVPKLESLSYYMREDFCDMLKDKHFSLFNNKNELTLFDLQINDIVSGRLPNWLYHNDQNSMMYSIENRSPLLDPRLIKYTKLPHHCKFKKGFNKYALREAMPSSMDNRVRFRRDKQGFRWHAPAFLQGNLNTVSDAIRESTVLSKVLDVDRLLCDFSSGIKNIDSSFILRLFSAALLEKEYPCTI